MATGGKQSGTDTGEIMEHVHAIREDFAALAGATGKLATGQFQKQAKRVGNLAGSAGEKAASYRDLLTDKVKDHPLASIGIAVLAGVILSSMRRR